MKVILPRQKRNFTCGIGAMAAAAQLLGLHFPKGTILSGIGAKPKVGTDNETLIKWALQYMPVTSHGSDTYKGGLAIANIQNQHSRVGHYVTLLGEKDGRFRYYCPLLGMVFEQSKENIFWMNSSGDLKNWSINFKCDQDFYALEVEPESHIFFIGDAIETLKQEADTSLTIKSAYEAREQSTSWHTPDAIFTKGRHLFLNGVPVLKNDIVWLRCDPHNTVHYYEMLRRLCATDAVFLNDPKSILTFHDKLSANHLNEVYQYTVSNEDNVRRCYKHLTTAGFSKFIVKAPSRFGGDRIYKAESLEELLQIFNENVEDSGYVIMQGFINMDKPTDTRVLITHDKIIGVVDRIAKEGDFICNLSAGGTQGLNTKLSETQLSLVKSAQKLLRQNDIFLAGLDFLGDKLIEVNVSCPSAVVYINKVTGDAVEFDIIDAAQEWIALRRLEKIEAKQTFYQAPEANTK